MITRWIEEIKEKTSPKDLGMILIHNGIVRATSKDGKAIKSMRLSYDKEKLSEYIDAVKKREGIADIKAWINEGELKIGDDIMLILVAGRFRTDVLPVLQEVLSKIKKEIVREEEIF